MAAPTPDNSPIQEYYNGTTLLITGATGYIGKILLEKLLRGCPGIKKIYVLIREKDGEKPQQRLQKIFENALFKTLVSANNGSATKKVQCIQGDCTLPSLGLSADDLNIVKNEVNIVFHNASLANYDAPLKYCIKTNIGGTKSMVELAKKIKTLKTLIYISTVYSGFPHLELEEIIHSTGSNVEMLLELAEKSNSALEAAKDKVLTDWPNSSVYTKAVAEDYIQKEAKDICVGVVRPSIVLSTFKEPIEGWTEMSSAPTKLSYAYLTGLFHSPFVNKEAAADVMPADYTINAIITCAWGCYNKDLVMKDNKEIYQSTMHESIFDDTQKKSDLPVFNVVSSTLNVLRWGTFWQYMRMMSDSLPFQSMVWFQYIFTTNCKYAFLLYLYFLHYPFMFILKKVYGILGQKDHRNIKIGEESIKIMEQMRPLAQREFMILNHNTQNVFALLSEQDKKDFYYDFSKLDWYSFIKTHVSGCRVHLAGESFQNMPEAASKHRKLKMFNLFVGSVLAFIVGRILMYILGIKCYYE